jgi:NADH-quinone oxidoreductase subunit N
MESVLTAADVWAVLPIVVVSVTGLLMVIIDAVWNDSPVIPLTGNVGMAVAVLLEMSRIGDPGLAFSDMVFYGGLSSFANIVILLAGILSLVLSVPYLRQIRHNYGEVHALVVFSVVGMMVLASANSLVTVFVGLETMSIPLYVLTGMVRESPTANESALKYFLLGAFATGFFLYGIALLYGATGTMYLNEIGAGLQGGGRPVMFWVGVGLLLVGFLFKVSAVPFHMWTPDAYQGAPTTMTAFMSTGSKTAAFASLILVLYHALDVAVEQWQWALAVVAVLTMVLGNAVALAQNNVKRMLAYSAVAHAGYVLTGLAAANSTGYSGALYYLLVYTLMNIGAFGVMAELEWDDEQGRRQTLESLAGIGYRKPVLGVVMGICMFSLVGFPPLGGFIGKWKVFSAAIDGGMTWLAIIGVITSVISAGYYLRVLVYFWMRSPEEAPAAVQSSSFPVTASSTIVLLFCAIGLLALGILPSGVLEITNAFFEAGSSMALTP